MEKQFRELEASFDQLKGKFKNGDISRDEFLGQLKKLRLKDDEGKFWMIGAQSGKWYYYDGKKWIQAEPPTIQEGKAICIYCGFENKITSEVCARCGGNIRKEKKHYCPECGYPLKDSLHECPRCSGELEDTYEEEVADEQTITSFTFRGINPLSLFYFFGFLGIIIGVVFGAFAGATDYFSGIIKVLPGFLQSLQGRLVGGIIFAGLGGIAGFIITGIFGYIIALIVNTISSLIGGVKIRLGSE